MKYCYQCGRMTAGEPLFCNYCGRSYEVKLCSRLHANPRAADVCSQCGSRELSTPQPKVSLWWHFLGYFVRLLLGTFLVYVSISVLMAVVETPEAQNALVILGVLVALLWWLWSRLPDWFRKTVRRSSKRKERGNGR